MWFDSLQVQHEKKCGQNKTVTSWLKPFVGAIEPHMDKGGLHNVRMVFSFAAVSASEEGEDVAPFNPPTMHAGADFDACCATIIGRLQNGTVTLQVGGVGFHAVGPLSPGCVRLKNKSVLRHPSSCMLSPLIFLIFFVCTHLMRTGMTLPGTSICALEIQGPFQEPGGLGRCASLHRQLLDLLVPFNLFLKPDRDVRKDVDNLKSRWNHRCRMLDGDEKP
jgi:hypothetical protein